jgi:hypothetical protein
MKINEDNSIEFDHEYDAVLIIGNGFDLNYQLPTSYADFIETDYFLNLISDNNNLAKYLQGKRQLQNWIDIENELKIYATSKDSDKTRFFENFKDISNALSEYLSKIKLDTFDRENIGYRLLKDLKNVDTLIIDFNYTNTISILLNFSYQINNCEFLGIFGHSLGETDHMYFKDFFYKECFKEDGNKRNIVIFHCGEKSYYDIFSQLDILTLNKISKLKQNNKLKLIDTKK